MMDHYQTISVIVSVLPLICSAGRSSLNQVSDSPVLSDSMGAQEGAHHSHCPEPPKPVNKCEAQSTCTASSSFRNLLHFVIRTFMASDTNTSGGRIPVDSTETLKIKKLSGQQHPRKLGKAKATDVFKRIT